MTTKNVAILLAGLLIIGSAQATLIDRGGGLIYDTDRNITWLADANLIASNSFGLTYGAHLGPYPTGSSNYPYNVIYSNGLATWGGAMFWIDAMNASDYLGYNNWRLPSALNPDLSGPCSYSNCTGSELGHLFYEELGGTFNSSILSSGDPDLSLFSNLQSYVYWSGTAYAQTIDGVWNFRMDEGLQGGGSKNGQTIYAWAVRDGDVAAAAIPEPETYALLLAGLGLIGFVASRGSANKVAS